MNFVLLIARSFLQALPLLVVDLTVPIPRHDWALLTEVRVLEFIIVVLGLCIVGGRSVGISATLDIRTQTEILEVVLLLPVLCWRHFLVLGRNILTWTVVCTCVDGSLGATVHGILGGLVGSISSEEVASLGVDLVVHCVGTTLPNRVVCL